MIRPPEAPGGDRSEPSEPINTLVGYGWVTADKQDLDQQVTLLEEAGCSRIFTDVSPDRRPRPGRADFLEYLRPKDLVVVTELSRLAKSLPELIQTVVDLQRRQVGLRSLAESIDTSSSDGRQFFRHFEGLAGCMRALSSESTREGLKAARGRGQKLGRPPALDAEQIHRIRLLLARPGESVASVARRFGVSRNTVYKYVPELRSDAGGRRALSEEIQIDDEPG